MATSLIKDDLSIPQGTTKTYQLKFKQDGAYIDITDWTILFTVKAKMIDADGLAKITKTVTTHTDPTNGETEIVLSKTDTNITPGSYVFEVTMIDDASPANILIIRTGKLQIERRVSTRES